GDRRARGRGERAVGVREEDAQIDRASTPDREIVAAVAVEVRRRDRLRVVAERGGDPGAAVKLPSPFPSRIATVCASWVATARSGLPSPFRSPVEIHWGSDASGNTIGEPGAGLNPAAA